MILRHFFCCLDHKMFESTNAATTEPTAIEISQLFRMNAIFINKATATDDKKMTSV